MKEMSIEDKAKAYDEAIKYAQYLMNERCKEGTYGSFHRADLNKMFPELKESEDERMMNQLHSWMKEFGGAEEYTEKVYQWIKGLLEKQGNKDIGISEATKQELEDNLNKALEKETAESWNEFLDEQKPTDIPEDFEKLVEYLLSFSDGEGHGSPAKVKEVSAELFKLAKLEQKPTDKVEPKFKVGDWVIDKQGIVHQIANVIENVTNHTYAYDIVGGGYFNDNTEGVRLWTIQDAKKGDVLSYRDGQWIFILEEIENNNSIIKYYVLLSEKGLGIEGAALTSLISAILPATKEQRELLFQKMKEAGYEWDAENKKLKKEEVYNLHNYLYGKQKPTAWSEEDELSCFESALFTAFSDAWQSYLLQDKVNVKQWAKEHSKELLEAAKEELKEQKSTWSEEDEKKVDRIITILKPLHETESDYNKYKNSLIAWLKSLKDRYTWKPSDEDLIYLKRAAENYDFCDGERTALMNLYNYLKKL